MVCRRYTRAFLHPLAAKGLAFAANLITYHNIAYMMVGERASHLGEGPWPAGVNARSLPLLDVNSWPSSHTKGCRACMPHRQGGSPPAPSPPSPTPFSFSACLPRSGRPSRSSGTRSLCGSTWRGSSRGGTYQTGCVTAASWRASRWMGWQQTQRQRQGQQQQQRQEQQRKRKQQQSTGREEQQWQQSERTAEAQRQLQAPARQQQRQQQE